MLVLGCANKNYGFVEPLPAPPSDLKAFASAYFRIGLSWVENADNERGYRIERRDGQAGPWEEIVEVEADAATYLDQSPPLSPETEYCYRVTAYNATGQSAPSNEACDTTIPVPVVECSSDPGREHRDAVIDILSDGASVEWINAVGLAGADPNHLQLITSDSICQQIWDGIGLGEEAHRVTFFQLGNRYVVADLVGEQILVTDEQFNLINPILVHY